MTTVPLRIDGARCDFSNGLLVISIEKTWKTHGLSLPASWIQFDPNFFTPEVSRTGNFLNVLSKRGPVSSWKWLNEAWVVTEMNSVVAPGFHLKYNGPQKAKLDCNYNDYRVYI